MSAKVATPEGAAPQPQKAVMKAGLKAPPPPAPRASAGGGDPELRDALAQLVQAQTLMMD